MELMIAPGADDAKRLATSAHRGQVDRQGRPYIEHVLRVGEDLLFNLDASNDMVIAAYLHDVVEDTAIDLDYLTKVGFSRRVIDLVDAVSRRDDERYDKYIERVARNRDAAVIKIADLTDNLDETRGPIPESLRTRYEVALERLRPVAR
jgi:(p)ppGpp synthase/HD superfamily hydrolase